MKYQGGDGGGTGKDLRSQLWDALLPCDVTMEFEGTHR